ncbi:hypothetical protein CGCSCA1_v011669 [Colletotrichum siamense]|nr:hypothetical protein CGCSCA1_v011669 [Colletotrichum siamense]KAI8175870.1 hypothetical protein K4K51_007115 [Colletotrichum sp. SAR 10_75]KAI8214962.1 hypothetical protein K4K52_011695 [Colletotrichum sp. SAR 10_76]KAI8219531.1 hypothetical protein K4K53_008273 [Colletotrichum sp. SAR 10_77]
MSSFFKADTRTVTLSDGRVLTFGLYGAGSRDLPPTAPPSPNQPTIFYFHGFPSSHDEAFIFHEAACKHGVQLIALDRPGHAGSTFQPNRRIIDWPADVLAVADHYHVQRFGVLGLSGGSPYVLSSWNTISRDRLVTAGICSGLYPPSLGFAGMLLQGRAMLTLAPWIAPVVAWGMDWTLCRAARDEEHPERLEQTVLEDLKSRPAADLAVLDPDLGGVRSAMVASVREAMKPGGKGPAEDVKLAGSHWGFELEDLHVQKSEMTWWHGAEDANVPVAMAQKASKCVPGAELRISDDEGHVSLAIHKAEEIICDLARALLMKS